MERVADRAETSRAVIYRRWSSRHELVIAALLHQQPTGTGRIPDTGSLREDVLTIMRRAARRISDIGPATVVGLLNHLTADDTFDTIIDQLARSGGEVINQVLAHAAARGEAREHVPERVARLPLDCEAETAPPAVAERDAPAAGVRPSERPQVSRLDVRGRLVGSRGE